MIKLRSPLFVMVTMVMAGVCLSKVFFKAGNQRRDYFETRMMDEKHSVR